MRNKRSVLEGGSCCVITSPLRRQDDVHNPRTRTANKERLLHRSELSRSERRRPPGGSVDPANHSRD
ncbi:Hypothetical protein SMAX5B_001851 [Scophthalmus maximus]|uniref:Uncharacterized protein n=1 Tax=Scophthalmus maximus TaxID=52904 RepID=A0A2U9CVR0_SCOMX|nr:Hypothetical protein SMAX5B_001851 [Scophthalmus maximus]KAF0028199.1 hypothetical protein F2P81_019286 [Scophthalmus maximus]